MSLTRRIFIQLKAFNDPHVKAAVAAENTKETERSTDKGYVSFSDNSSDDYPELIKALQNGNYPYAMHRERENEGQHDRYTCWSGGGPDESPYDGSGIDFISNI